MYKWSLNNFRATEKFEATGLAHLQKCMFPNVNMPLISAFVERWYPETNSFHLPFGEMTITLHDVWYLLQIPVAGFPVMGESSLSELRPRIGGLLGWTADQVDAEFKTHLIKLNTIQRECGTGGPMVGPERKATAYLLWTLGASLFVDKSKTSVTSQLLPFLDPLEEVPNYAWGTAALAYLYRQLGIASRRDTTQMAGCLTLLEVSFTCWFNLLIWNHLYLF